MNRVLRAARGSASVHVAGMAPVQPDLATSPLAAMNMAGGGTGESALPITVTITITTVLWPGTAH